MIAKEYTVKVTYNNIEIGYNEDKNIWEFELRGRARTAPSLQQAKESIDKLVRAAKKESTFEKCQAWFLMYGERFLNVDVTSYAGFFGCNHEFWTFIHEFKRRERRSNRELFKVNDHNEKLKSEYESNLRKIALLYEANAAIIKQMQVIEAPAPEE